MRNPQYPHAMFDTETLGLGHDAVVFQVGLVFFDVHEESIQRYEFGVSVDEQLAAGRTTDESTIKWWESQGPAYEAARTKLLPLSMSVLRDQVRAAFFANSQILKVQVWAKGSDFDIPKIVSLLGGENGRPWRYYNTRCMRTLTKLFPDLVVNVPPNPHPHDALEDAAHQASITREYLRHINRMGQSNVHPLRPASA